MKELREYEIGLYEKAMPNSLSLAEKLTLTGELGYDYMEMSIDESDDKLARLDWSDDKLDELASISRQIGVPIGSICLSGHRKYPLGSESQAERGMEVMEKALHVASKLGVRVIQLAGYDVYYEQGNKETQKRFIENLKKSALLAAKAGVYLGFETMETPFMDTVWKAMFYVQAVHSPWLGVYPDSGNLTNAAKIYQSDVLPDLKSGDGHICALHLKETIPGHYREIPFGTGHVDFGAIINTAWQMGVRRYVTEMWYVNQPEWKKDIAKARSMMTNLLDEHCRL